jgi:hypothetical protein
MKSSRREEKLPRSGKIKTFVMPNVLEWNQPLRYLLLFAAMTKETTIPSSLFLRKIRAGSGWTLIEFGISKASGFHS